MELARTNPYTINPRGRRSGSAKRQVPGRQKHNISLRDRHGKIAAAGELCGGYGFRAKEEILHRLYRLGAALADDAHPAAVAKDLPSVMGDPENGALKRL